MNNKLTILISASVGGAIGAGVTYLVLKKKTEEKISEEVNKFKESMEEFKTPLVEKKEDISETKDHLPDLKVAFEEADNLIEEFGYGEAMLHPGPLSTVIVNDEDTTADDIRDAPPQIREELLEEAIDSSSTLR